MTFRQRDGLDVAQVAIFVRFIGERVRSQRVLVLLGARHFERLHYIDKLVKHMANPTATINAYSRQSVTRVAHNLAGCAFKMQIECKSKS